MTCKPYVIKVLFPFKYPMKSKILSFGGILTQGFNTIPHIGPCLPEQHLFPVFWNKNDMILALCLPIVSPASGRNT